MKAFLTCNHRFDNEKSATTVVKYRLDCTFVFLDLVSDHPTNTYSCNGLLTVYVIIQWHPTGDFEEKT